MDLGIRGRSALVWGGSRGMGRAAAEALAREGVEVTIAARKRDVLEHAAKQIGARGVVADLTTEAGRAAALAACPQPDILINNADGPAPGDFRRWEREDWVRTLDGMMLGPIFMMRAVVDGMVERTINRIVILSTLTVKSS